MKRLALLSILALSISCGPELEDEDHETEPTAEDIDAVSAGTIDCTKSSGTGYRSGTAFAIEVVTVDGKPVESRTADGFWVMREAAAMAGVEIFVVSGFRTNEEQRFFYNCFINCNCNNCNRAARPGFSNHQSGSALDLNSSGPGVRNWLVNNARRFGFTATVSGEPWHYELTGRPVGTGPCAQQQQMTFTSPAPGAELENSTGSLKVRATVPVHHVRYLSESRVLGTSENAGNEFEVRATFGSLGAKGIDAVAYDAEDREVARTHVEAMIIPSLSPPQELLSFEDVSDLSWYRNGFALRASTSGNVVRVAYSAGRFELGESSDPSDAFGVHRVFDTIGWRALLAIGYDANGEELGRATTLVRVLPGEEGGGASSVSFYPRSGEHIANGTAIVVGGSESVERMRFYADDVELGVVPGDRGKFAFIRTFTTTGSRRLKAEGLNGEDVVVASEEINAIIDP